MAQFQVTSIFKWLKSRSKPKQNIPRAVWHDPVYFLAFGLGSGTIPFAPGTFGTIAAIPFYLFLSLLPRSIYSLFVIAFIIFSSWVCERVSREMKVHDHPGICIDEFAGFFVTMIYAPQGWLWILIGFVLFRLFDVLKPWPIHFLDRRIHGGFGIVLDDVVAGIYACLIIQILSNYL